MRERNWTPWRVERRPVPQTLDGFLRMCIADCIEGDEAADRFSRWLSGGEA